MDIKLQKKDTFYICGYFVETSVETCGADVAQLWHDFERQKEELFSLLGHKNDFYGLMWYTENHRYCYLIGIETGVFENKPAGALCKCIPGTDYAIASVPPDTSAVDAWTAYFNEVLPSAGYVPDVAHGLYFEYYPDGNQGAYELWTPVRRRSVAED